MALRSQGVALEPLRFIRRKFVPKETLLVRVLCIGVVATLAIASIFAPTATWPANATEKLTLSHESMARVMKMKQASKKPRASDLASGRAKAGTGDGKYTIRKLPGRPK